MLKMVIFAYRPLDERLCARNRCPRAAFLHQMVRAMDAESPKKPTIRVILKPEVRVQSILRPAHLLSVGREHPIESLELSNNIVGARERHEPK